MTLLSAFLFPANWFYNRQNAPPFLTSHLDVSPPVQVSGEISVLIREFVYIYSA